MKKLTAFLAGTALMLTAGTALATPAFVSGYESYDAPLWSITDQHSSQTSGFTIYFQDPSFKSDFGLFNVNDTANPSAIKGDLLQVFAYDEAPKFGPVTNASVKFRYNLDHWEASLNGAAPWKPFDPIFGFYFGVHTTQTSTADYNYYTLSSLNTLDAGLSHIAIGYNNQINSATLYLEGLPYSQTSPDFNEMKILLSDVAPVPEPGTMMLLGAGLFGIAVYGKRRRNA